MVTAAPTMLIVSAEALSLPGGHCVVAIQASAIYTFTGCYLKLVKSSTHQFVSRAHPRGKCGKAQRDVSSKVNYLFSWRAGGAEGGGGPLASFCLPPSVKMEETQT